MALELAELNPKSVPINFLNPIEGTPMKIFMKQLMKKKSLKLFASLGLSCLRL